MNLSLHFTLDEMTRSRTAIRRGIPNVPSPRQIECLRAWCEHIGEPCRDHFGPLVVSSGFRSKALNFAIGGAAKSAHMIEDEEAAVDLEAPVGAHYSNRAIFVWLSLNVPFCKLIDEFGFQWVHVSYRRGGPQDETMLRAYHTNEGTKYAPLPGTA